MNLKFIIMRFSCNVSSIHIIIECTFFLFDKAAAERFLVAGVICVTRDIVIKTFFFDKWYRLAFLIRKIKKIISGKITVIQSDYY